MTAQQFADASFTHADPAFEPHSEFDFAEANEGLHSFPSYGQYGDQFGAMSGRDLQNHQQNQTNLFGPGEGQFPVGTSAFAPGTSATSDIDPSHVWGVNANKVPTSTQNEIIKSRYETAAQRYGQVTPPEDMSVTGYKPPEDGEESKTSKPAKMDKSQRARNAAVSRHSKAKLQRALNAESLLESGAPEGEDKKERYREKNRQAAAKCRQKKKENTDDLESKHRSLSAHNSFLRNELRQLRDQLVELRMQALPHHDSDPRCRCTGLHHFNRAQAKRLTETATLGHLGLANSPPTMSEGNDSAAPSPRSMPDMTTLPRVSSGMPAMPSRPASFTAPRTFGYDQDPIQSARRPANSVDNGMLFFGNMQGSSGHNLGGLRSSPIDNQHTSTVSSRW